MPIRKFLYLAYYLAAQTPIAALSAHDAMHPLSPLEASLAHPVFTFELH